jgi:ketosteroid isomerase-like protein
MDDIQAIRLAKTELREAYRTGSVARALGVISGGFSDMTAGCASFWGAEAKSVLEHRLRQLFARYHAHLAVTIISIRVQGRLAFDWGWHKLTLKPKKKGRAITRRTRYLEIWQKETDGQWRIAIYMDNPDVPPQMPPAGVLRQMNRRLQTKTA